MAQNREFREFLAIYVYNKWNEKREILKNANKSGYFAFISYGMAVIFNHGVPSAFYEALSREVSLYNGQPSSLVGVPQDVYGREVSVLNSNVPTVPLEAFSHEVSVYNGQSPPLAIVPQEVYGREVSVFNDDQSLAGIRIASREVSVFNFGPPAAAIEAVSRELSLFNHTLE